MQKITKYLSKSQIKPELSLVYVHEIDGLKYAVATDSFRLVQELIPDILQDAIQYGYYQPKAWDEIVKAYNKKIPDIRTIDNTVQGQQAIQMQYSTYNYPEYQRIIPTDADLTSYSPEKPLNMQYFKDFLDMITLDKYGHFNFSDIKQGKTGMLYYKTETLKVLLMPANN